MTATFMEVMENQTGYFGEGWQYPIFAIALAALLILWRRRDAAIATLYTVIMLVVIYCPLTADILMRFLGDNVYWRMFWLLPIIPILGVAMVEFIPLTINAFYAMAKRKADDTGHKSGGRFITILAVALVLAIYGGLLYGGGYFVYQDGNVTWAKNLEKLPPEVIDVVDALNVDYEAEPVGEKKLAAVGTIVPFIRQYDSTILLSYGRSTIQKEKKTGAKGQLYLQLTTEEQPDYDLIEELLTKTKATYLIIADNMSVRSVKMSDHGYEVIYDNGAYTLMKRRA